MYSESARNRENKDNRKKNREVRRRRTVGMHSGGTLFPGNVCKRSQRSRKIECVKSVFAPVIESYVCGLIIHPISFWAAVIAR